MNNNSDKTSGSGTNSRHTRHTLFTNGVATSSGQTLNYDIEAVKLDHSRRGWTTSAAAQKADSGNPGVAAPKATSGNPAPVGGGKKMSISSEDSLSDFEELGGKPIVENLAMKVVVLKRVG